MIRHCALFSNEEFQIARCDHPPADRHCDPSEEIASEYSVNRVEFGGFTLEVAGQSWELSQGDIFCTYPGMTYCCGHRELIPTDVCVSVAFVAQDASGEIRAFESATRRSPVRPGSNRLGYLFFSAVRNHNEPMVAEQVAHALITDAACDPGNPRVLYREHQLNWYAERVEAARWQLDHRPAEHHTLAKLARSVAMSPFHFARIFRELTGIPPHAYLCRARLRHAANSLREGSSVTEACLNSGFQNLSHFCRQFQRHFGVKASVYTAKRH
jgi:AraC family transcriptional regulator